MENERKHSKRQEIQHQILSALAVLVVGALVILLVKPGNAEPQTAREADTELSAPARAVAHGELFITPATPLAEKLTYATVSTQKLNTPLLATTGAVTARLAVGAGFTHVGSSTPTRPATRLPVTQPATAATTHPASDGVTEFPAWEFGSPDLFGTYTAWIQSQDDVRFNVDEVAKIHKLDESRVDDALLTRDRLKKLVDAGSDAPKDLQAAETALLQSQLQMEKDVFDAQKALRDVEKVRDNLARQLVAADANPDLLVGGIEGTVIVAADVPESRVPLIQVGASCTARFYGLPGARFDGKVGRLGAVLVKDRRTLRVLFLIKDPDNRLHSNMFAEVGLGTDEREAMVVPVNALIHDGGADYVLVGSARNTYRATEVLAGDPVGGADVEILKGLNVGDQIISGGTILLKPYIVHALEEVK